MSTEQKKANVIKANYKLQQKVGSGPLDEKAVMECQKVIETNEVDFGPIGVAILDKLAAALERAKDPSVTMQEIKTILTAPIMELKANAGIFGYALIGNLANIMLSFLEAILVLDNDAIEIVKAHHKSLHMILVRGMKGDGGEAGKHLEQELRQACDRYYHKKFGKEANKA